MENCCDRFRPLKAVVREVPLGCNVGGGSAKMPMSMTFSEEHAELIGRVVTVRHLFSGEELSDWFEAPRERFLVFHQSWLEFLTI